MQAFLISTCAACFSTVGVAVAHAQPPDAVSKTTEAASETTDAAPADEVPAKEEVYTPDASSSDSSAVGAADNAAETPVDAPVPTSAGAAPTVQSASQPSCSRQLSSAERFGSTSDQFCASSGHSIGAA